MIIAGIKSLVTGLLPASNAGNWQRVLSSFWIIGGYKQQSLHWHANHIIAQDRYKIKEFQQRLLGFHFRVLDCIPCLLALWHACALISLVGSAISLATEPLIRISTCVRQRHFMRIRMIDSVRIHFPHFP